MQLVKITISFFVIWMLIWYSSAEDSPFWNNFYYVFDKTFQFLCVLTIRQFVKVKIWRKNLYLWGWFLGIRAILPIIAMITKYGWINHPVVVGSLFFLMVVLIAIITYPDFENYLKKHEWLK